MCTTPEARALGEMSGGTSHTGRTETRRVVHRYSNNVRSGLASFDSGREALEEKRHVGVIRCLLSARNQKLLTMLNRLKDEPTC